MIKQPVPRMQRVKKWGPVSAEFFRAQVALGKMAVLVLKYGPRMPLGIERRYDKAADRFNAAATAAKRQRVAKGIR